MKNQNIFHRAGFAIAGLKAAWKSEKSVRLHGIVIICVALMLMYFHPWPIWWAVIALAAGFMLVVELVNTAVEKLADHLRPEMHPDIKFVKDVLAGAVLVSCIAAGCVLLAFIKTRF